MNEFLIVVYQIAKFMIMIGIGVICVKCSILKEEHLPVMSRLIMKVILPVFIFTNTVGGATRADLIEDFIVLPVSIGVYLLWIFVGRLLAKIQRIEESKYKVYQAVYVFGNVGFIGIPLISALYAEKGMVYIALFTIIDQMVLWTYGVYLTSEEEGKPSLANLKNMVNPPLAAILLAIVIVLLQVPVPSVVYDALKSVGNASSPLSLIYIGASMCFCHFGEVVRRKEIYVGIAVKMLLLPVLVYLILRRLIGIEQTISMTMALLTALPCMTTVPMMAKQNNAEPEFCLSAVMIGQAASLATLPVVCYVIMTVL